MPSQMPIDIFLIQIRWSHFKDFQTFCSRTILMINISRFLLSYSNEFISRLTQSHHIQHFMYSQLSSILLIRLLCKPPLILPMGCMFSREPSSCIISIAFTRNCFALYLIIVMKQQCRVLPGGHCCAVLQGLNLYSLFKYLIKNVFHDLF